MKTSESITKIAGAMLKVEAAIKNPVNNKLNVFYDSKYAPLDKILEDLRPLLSDNGLVLIQSPASNADDRVGVDAILIHTSGEFIDFDTFYFKVGKQKKDGSIGEGLAQDAGSAITYARRYQVNAIFNIAGEADDDGNGASGITGKAETGAGKQAETAIKCDVCGGAIGRSKNKTAAEIAAGTKAETGSAQCLKCYRAGKSAENIKAKIEGGDAAVDAGDAAASDEAAQGAAAEETAKQKKAKETMAKINEIVGDDDDEFVEGVK